MFETRFQSFVLTDNINEVQVLEDINYLAFLIQVESFVTRLCNRQTPFN